jgi:hypothetical protein
MGQDHLDGRAYVEEEIVSVEEQRERGHGADGSADHGADDGAFPGAARGGYA